MKRLGAVVFVVLASVSACASDDGRSSSTDTPDAVPNTSAPGDTASTPPASTTSSSSSTSAPATSSSISVEPTPATSLSPEERITPDGFAAVAATATTATGEVCELCLWVARTPEDRARGLMFVTDLGGADGMAFVYDEPTTTAFWMKNTPMPLSIAFYDTDGEFLGGSDMAPCRSDPCERYPTPMGFSVAIEVAQGTAESVGLTPGSTFVMSDLPCSPSNT